MNKENKAEKERGPFNKELQKAVDYLRDTKVIKASKDIVEKTRYGKSTVSEYISGSKEASEEFLKKFEEVFELKIPRDSPAKDENNSGATLLGPTKKGLTIDDYIAKIEEHNAFLQSVINNGLVSVAQAVHFNSDKLQAMTDYSAINQKSWVEIIAWLQANGDEEKKQSLMDEMGKIIASHTR